ncbi:MAG: AraC family ligand binding domain-containing protein, partial [Spirochaetia bacterium]|nr:AraC family ligand binding domain-containing protein [Spirochaetia bacterium]
MKRKSVRSAPPFSVFRTTSKHGNPDTRFYLGKHPTGQLPPYVGLIELQNPEPPRELHSHPTFEIHFVVRGRMAFHTAKGLELLSAGDVFIAAPGEPHGNGPFTHVRTSIFTLMLGITAQGGLTGLDPDHSPEIKKSLEKMSGFSFRAGTAVGESFHRIRRLSEGKTPFPEWVFQTAICDILQRLLESKLPGKSAKL